MVWDRLRRTYFPFRMNISVFDQRRAGLLFPVYSLRRNSDMGVGDTAAVLEAIDFCSDHGFSVLQLLPIQETLGDPSPYSPVSSRALSPSLLTLTPEKVPGLTQEDLENLAPESWILELRKGNVDHANINTLKNKLLTRAAKHFFDSTPERESGEKFANFQEAQEEWLPAYTLYRTLVEMYDGNTKWTSWRLEQQSYSAAKEWLEQQSDRETLEQRRKEFAFIQWVAWQQWREVREYADQRQVRMIGELTFGVSANSCDVWANPPLFDTSWHLGTRPLSHFDTNKDSEVWGQNWGLPAYRWENHRASQFKWLRGRIAWQKEFFHGCRLDHLRGYFRAYMFPWPGGERHVEFSSMNEQEAAAATGGLLPRFVPGPDEDPITAEMNRLQGNEIIGQLIEEAGDMDMVAEIMGDMPEYMSRTLDELQLANLRFPQLERGSDHRINAPDTFRELGLITYANHDNAPLAMLYLHLLSSAEKDPESASARDLKALMEFANWKEASPPEITTELLEKLQEALFKTSSRLAVLMCSDLIGLPLRFNLPGSYGEKTWSDRLPMTLTELQQHTVYGARIETAARLIKQTERVPHQSPIQ